MIKEVVTPRLKNPIFIVAWPGMGEVAYRCALFLKEVMGFKMFAKLEAGEFFKPAAVSVDKGVLDLPSFPAGFFYYIKGKNSPDIILFLGEAQPPLEYGERLSAQIIDFVKKYNAKFVFSFAAKPEAVDHKTNPAVWIAATHKTVFKKFEKFKLKVLSEGQISGLNGIILGVGKNKGLKGACLLGEVPFYMVQIENPKASNNILKIVDKYLGLKLIKAGFVDTAGGETTLSRSFVNMVIQDKGKKYTYENLEIHVSSRNDLPVLLGRKPIFEDHEIIFRKHENKLILQRV